jgi:hypothetical protein
MNTGTIFLRVSMALLTLLMTGVNAFACPDCALANSGGVIEPQTVMAKMAFSSSTLLLLGIFFSVSGFLTWLVIKTCREFTKECPLSSFESEKIIRIDGV